MTDLYEKLKIERKHFDNEKEKLEKIKNNHSKAINNLKILNEAVHAKYEDGEFLITFLICK